MFLPAIDWACLYRSCVYVTDDPAEAAALADQVSIMGDGRIVETGTVEELRDHLVQRSLLKNLELK